MVANIYGFTVVKIAQPVNKVAAKYNWITVNALRLPEPSKISLHQRDEECSSFLNVKGNHWICDFCE